MPIKPPVHVRPFKINETEQLIERAAFCAYVKTSPDLPISTDTESNRASPGR